MFFTFGEIGTTLRVRARYFIICTVYAVTGELAGEINTGSMKYANAHIFSSLQIYGASRDGGAVIKLMLLPLKSKSSADLFPVFP